MPYCRLWRCIGEGASAQCIVSNPMGCTYASTEYERRTSAPLLPARQLATLKHRRSQVEASLFSSALPHCHVCSDPKACTFRAAAVLWLLPNEHQHRILHSQLVNSTAIYSTCWLLRKRLPCSLPSARLLCTDTVAGAALPLPPQHRHVAGGCSLPPQPLTLAGSVPTSCRRPIGTTLPSALQEHLGGLGATARHHARLQRRFEVVKLEALTCSAKTEIELHDVQILNGGETPGAMSRSMTGLTAVQFRP